MSYYKKTGTKEIDYDLVQIDLILVAVVIFTIVWAFGINSYIEDANNISQQEAQSQQTTNENKSSAD